MGQNPGISAPPKTGSLKKQGPEAGAKWIKKKREGRKEGKGGEEGGGREEGN